MDNILFLSAVFCAFLPLTTIFALTPYIARKGTCFGVMLMEDAQRSQKIKKIKRDYTIAAVASGIFFAAVCVMEMNFYVLLLSIIGYCIVGLALYITFNAMLRNLVMTEDWENLQKEIGVRYIPNPRKIRTISALWYLLYIPVAAALWIISAGSAAPYALVIPVCTPAVGAMVLIVHFMVTNCGQYVNKMRLKDAIEENLRQRRRWSVFIFALGLLLQLLLAALQLGLLGVIPSTVVVTAAPFAFTLVVTAATVVFALRNNRPFR